MHRKWTAWLLSCVLGACVHTNGVPPSGGAIAFAAFGPQNTDIFVGDANGAGPQPIAPHAALDYNASFSRDGQRIIFTSERGGSADIWQVNADGSGLKRIVDNPAFDDQAALSPDGRTLAFVSSRSGQADIWLLDMTTGAVRNLTNTPSGEFRPSWSADGQWLAFSSDRDSARPHSGFVTLQSIEIYIVKVDGSGLRRLTATGKYAGSPSWSTDGKTIVFYEAELPEMNRIISPRRISGTTQIAAIDVATGERRTLTSGNGEKWSPRFMASGRIGYAKGGAQPGLSFVEGRAGAPGETRAPDWSADGAKVVFHRELETAWPPHRDVHGIDKRYRLVRSGVFASYSPDGSHYVVNDGTAGIVHNSILIAKADGSDRKVLFSDKEKSALAPMWSPKGGRIAFALGRFFQDSLGPASAVIATIGTDGKQLDLLTPDTENAGFPSWSPDERFLVYRVSADGKSGLRIIDVKTLEVRKLTDGTFNDNSPQWSPKGDLIVFNSKRDGEPDYDLYTIKPDGSGLTRLTHGPGNNSHPAWSPDGEWIAFTSAAGGFKDEAALHPFNPQAYGEITVMRADGSDVRVLTDNQFEDGTPTWIRSGASPR